MNSKLKKKILQQIKPNQADHKKREEILNLFKKKLDSIKKELSLECDFFVGGSYGKNTYLRESSDIDLFVRFDKKYEDSKISAYLQNMLEKSEFDYKKQKGSRDYFNVEFKEKNFYLKIEVVPIRKISDPKEALNSTDVSPLHVDFLKEKTRKNPNLKDEIRLAKQFFKAKKLYGAESYICGFSGHAIDMLIVYYKTLESLLNSAKNWEEKTFIDINNFYKNYNEALKHIDESKISSLIVVDPIIKQRNAARALSTKNYSRFLVIANNFDELRESDFIEEKFDIHKTIKGAKAFAKKANLSTYFYIFDVKVENNSEDIIGSKLLRLKSKFEKHFTNYDFTIFESQFFIDLKQNTCLFVFLFENKSIPSIKKVKGPYVHMSEPLNNFIANKEYYFVENNRVYAYEKRYVTNIDEIANLNISNCKNMLNKDVSFIKNLKIMKYN
jgi:tRNA nucleotidyltransferase (CCA-adding enzyme)